MKYWGPKLYHYLLKANVGRQGEPTLQQDEQKKKLSNILSHAAKCIPFYKAYKNVPFSLWPTVDENIMRESKVQFLPKKQILPFGQSTENISSKETKFLRKRNDYHVVKPNLHFNKVVGYVCEHQRLCFPKHLYWMEKVWVDDEKIRFIPVMTTLTRKSNILIRFRLNQIFMESDNPCECEANMWVIEKNISTADEILYLPHLYEKQSLPIFLDQIEGFFRQFSSIQAFQIVQQSLHQWLLKIKSSDTDLLSLHQKISKELENFLLQRQVKCPAINLDLLEDDQAFIGKSKIVKEYNTVSS